MCRDRRRHYDDGFMRVVADLIRGGARDPVLLHDFGLRQPMLHMVAHRRELRLVVVSPVAFAFSHERRLPAKPV